MRPGSPHREFVVHSIGAGGALPLLYIDDSVNDRLLVREAILLSKTPFAFYQADGFEAASYGIRPSPEPSSPEVCITLRL
jgi:hypothetical protein